MAHLRSAAIGPLPCWRQPLVAVGFGGLRCCLAPLGEAVGEAVREAVGESVSEAVGEAARRSTNPMKHRLHEIPFTKAAIFRYSPN